MTDKFQWFEFIVGSIVGVILIFLINLCVLDENTTNKRYKQGQIDALTGKVHYELVVKDDSTRVWEYKVE